MFSILYAFIWLITWLPLRFLYLFSDICYPVVYYIARYRRDTVKTNLAKSFPDKTEKERRTLERRFYHYFCDLFIESIYEMHLSEKEIRRRVTYGNLDAILEQYAQGKSVMMMTAHYGNWEWPSALSLYLPEEFKLYGIYKRLRNQKFDALMFSLRSRFGGVPVEKKEILRFMLKLRNEGKSGNFWMISDQTPNGRYIHFWTRFLNQDTPTLTGTEQLARKFDYPVFYVEITRTKRGYYHCEFIPISLEPGKTAEFEISGIYMQLLQKTIEAKPEYWLWSHRRWKHTRNQTKS
ncbi:MAG: lysophospholipid acyltransferase family protein [Bacteroidota bacterium]|nr:lysophospholipid acyltransferase family protein [Bacteroidota bacterium]